MCTCLIAGKRATVTGRVMLGANDDWDNVAGVLTHVPGKTYPADAMYQLVGGREIPQAAETFGYSYTACKYDIGNLDRGWAGGVNDCGVAVAGVGVSAFKSAEGQSGWMEPDDIPLLILMRATSARQGIRMIGDLIQQYGFGWSGLVDCASMAAFAIADAEEGWWLEVSGGRNWVATRVPDDEVSVRANAYGTHQADLTDTENVMASPGLAEFARAQGWWDGDVRSFDFSNAFGDIRSPNEWGPELDPMNMRRRWRAMCILSGGDTPEDALLYSVKPNRLLQVSDLQAVMRDVYDGTAYDLTKVPSAGRYGNPFHDDAPDYALCRRGTVASIVAELRPDSPSVMWTCMGTPRVGVYIPLYTNIDSLPPCCEEAEAGKPDAPSLFWAFKELFYMTCRRYALNIPLVEEVQARYEREAREDLAAADAELAALPEEQRQTQRTAFIRRQVEKALALAQKTRVELEYRF